MWTFDVGTGWVAKDGVLVSKNVYSGFGEGLNDSKYEAVLNVGPIPRGDWMISGPPFDGAHGPYCLRVTPKPGTETFSRSGFLIHGDEVEHPGEHLASHGCIVADRVTRTRIYQSGDPNLQVINSTYPPTSQGEQTT